jgi:hypothetical protein
LRHSLRYKPVRGKKILNFSGVFLSGGNGFIMRQTGYISSRLQKQRNTDNSNAEHTEDDHYYGKFKADFHKISLIKDQPG